MDEIRNKDVCLSHLKEIIGNEFDHIQTRVGDIRRKKKRIRNLNENDFRLICLWIILKTNGITI